MGGGGGATRTGSGLGGDGSGFARSTGAGSGSGGGGSSSGTTGTSGGGGSGSRFSIGGSAKATMLISDSSGGSVSTVANRKVSATAIAAKAGLARRIPTTELPGVSPSRTASAQPSRMLRRSRRRRCTGRRGTRPAPNP
jgi:hypothetical protein